MANAYRSYQDFYAQMARLAQPNRVLDQYLPRVLRNCNQTTFERYLHEAMGHRADQPEF